MASRELEKNERQVIRVKAYRYEEYNLVDARIFYRLKNKEGFGPTQKGFSLNVDMIPDLIDLLIWALGQPCEVSDDAKARPELRADRKQKLATAVRGMIERHGAALHWDTLERMLAADSAGSQFDKWHLHQVLAERSDVFEHVGKGRYRVRKTR